MRAALVLEDGAVFEGVAFGDTGRAFGEAVFYTGIVGYQEVVTDPSYRGMLVVLTYPMIGSYGVNADDSESEDSRAAGVVIRDYSARFSNFRATGSFEDFLREKGIPGVRGIDTRALAVYLRENGEMKGAIISGDFAAGEAAAFVRQEPSPLESDLTAGAPVLVMEGPAGRRLALLDLGAPRSLVAELGELGFRDARKVGGIKEALAAKAACLLAAGGPGDPRAARQAVSAVKSALGELPILGIGLGHSVLALALGCGVSRMKVGHHGANQSVGNLETGRCIITAQHHSFAVDNDVPDGVDLTYTNVNDGTVEGIRHQASAATGLAFRPPRDDMGEPSVLLKDFVEGRHA